MKPTSPAAGFRREFTFSSPHPSWPRRRPPTANVTVRTSEIVSVVAGLTALPSVALAEVCDKLAGENWMPSQGAVVTSPYGTIGSGAIAPSYWVALTTIALVCLAIATRSHVAAFLFASVTLLIASVVYLTSGVDHIWHSGVIEGCVKPFSQPPSSNVFAGCLVGLAVVFGAIGTFGSHRSVK